MRFTSLRVSQARVRVMRGRVRQRASACVGVGAHTRPPLCVRDMGVCYT